MKHLLYIVTVLLALLLVMSWGETSAAVTDAQPPPAVSANSLTEEAAQAIVRRLYREILHREADPGGLQNYTNALVSQGKDEAWLRQVLLNSVERKTLGTWQERQAIAFGASLLLSATFALIVRRSFGLEAGYQPALFYAITAGPVLAYFFLVVHFAVNIPHGDDYDVFLAFLNRPEQERFTFSTLFAQHNEHRVFFLRLLAQAVYALFGEIDFRLLALVGTVSLIGVALLLACIARSCHLGLVYFAPLMFIVFLTQSYENMTWATAAIQNNLVLFFSLTSLLLWERRSNVHTGLSMGAAACATYTSGSGLLIYIPLLVWAVLEWRQPESFGLSTQQDTRVGGRRLSVLVLCAVGVGLSYFCDYSPPGHHPSMIAALLNPWTSFQYFLAFLGGYLDSIALAWSAGLAAISCFLFLTWKQYFKTRPVLYFFLIYLFLVASVSAVTRSQFGVEQAMSSRYRIIPLLIVGCSYLSCLDFSAHRLESLRSRLIPGGAAIFLFLYSFFFYKAVLELSFLRHRLVGGIQTWQELGYGLSYPNQDRANSVLQKSLRRGVYRVPERERKKE